MTSNQTRSVFSSLVNSEEQEEQLATSKLDSRLLQRLRHMFPDAHPKYIENLCRNRTYNPEELQQLIDHILLVDYPKREQPQNNEEMFTTLQTIFPNANPEFLSFHMQEQKGVEELNKFIETTLEVEQDVVTVAHEQSTSIHSIEMKTKMYDTLRAYLVDAYPVEVEELTDLLHEDEVDQFIEQTLMNNEEPTDTNDIKKSIIIKKLKKEEPKEVSAARLILEVLNPGGNPMELQKRAEELAQNKEGFRNFLLTGDGNSISGYNPIMDDETGLNEASGWSQQYQDAYPINDRVEILKSYFPDADDLYLKTAVKDFPDPKDFQAFVSKLQTIDNLFPETDPFHLAKLLRHQPVDSEVFQESIDDISKSDKDYPSRAEWLQEQQIYAERRQYTIDFNVERFLEHFPNPKEVFEDPQRKSSATTPEDIEYVKEWMRNRFNALFAEDVNHVVTEYLVTNIAAVFKVLTDFSGNLRLTSKSSMTSQTSNIKLLQELAYFDHKTQILAYVAARDRHVGLQRYHAERQGQLQTCNVCYRDNLLPEEIYSCVKGCQFCRDCIAKNIQLLFDEKQVNIVCLGDGCDEEYPWQDIRSIVTPKLFEQLTKRKALLDVQTASLKDIEYCPMCRDFAYIPAVDDKVFRCLNDKCMLETCRECKESSHLPLKCIEVEKDEATKARTYIENQMAEALMRECYSCHIKFIKTEGCNKMTCACGAKMCYICRQPVTDYSHFNGNGGDRFDLCPLYCDDQAAAKQAVIAAGKKAKIEVGDTKLVLDPTLEFN